MNRIKLERYFYPVGQGLFCRERFYSEDNTRGQKDVFNLVYDCGSSNCGPNPHKYTKTMIEDLFKDITIDLLFISHFHADHINLLETINPKETAKKVRKVIMPYLSKEDLILVLSDRNYVPSEYTNKIVGIAAGIKEDSKEEKADDVNEKTQYYVLAKQDEFIDNRNNVVRNGENLLQKLFHNKPKISFWKFLPFNYNFPLAKGVFDNFLQKETDIKVNDISEIIKKSMDFKGLYKKIAKELHKKYPQICEDDLNEQSTVLFSFTNLETKILQQCLQYKCSLPILKHVCDNCKNKDTDKCRKQYCQYKSLCPLMNKNVCLDCINQWKNICISCKSFSLPLGCIYFGDYLMSSPRLCSDIRQNIYDNIAYIGTLQIPHHGSINGLFYNTRDYENKICVIPYGRGNKYSHPCQYVIQTILDNSGYPICATNGGGYMQSFVFEVKG